MNKKVIGAGVVLSFLFVVGVFSEKGETVVVPKGAAVNEDSAQLFQKSEVIRVSDFEQTLGGKPAVSIAFGESDAKWCDLTVQRASVSQGYKIISEQSERYEEISISCNSGESLYVSSANHKTSIIFEILSLDNQNKKAEALISANLINSKRVAKNQTDEFAEINKARLVITGQNFDNLTKQM